MNALAALQRREPAEMTAIVVDVVVDHYGHAAAEIHGRSQMAGIVWARHVAMVLAGEFTGENVSTLAMLFDVDRTSISHAIARVVDVSRGAPRVRAELAALRCRIEERAPETKHRSEGAMQRRRRQRGVIGAERIPRAAAEAELDQFMRQLRRGLLTALRIDPGAVLAGLKRAVDQVNGKESQP